ncbi:hypothetical protein HC928_20090, partial [bacterium]|nr:hypothetical protein [bacterium]
MNNGVTVVEGVDLATRASDLLRSIRQIRERQANEHVANAQRQILAGERLLDVMQM